MLVTGIALYKNNSVNITRLQNVKNVSSSSFIRYYFQTWKFLELYLLAQVRSGQKLHELVWLTDVGF